MAIDLTLADLGFDEVATSPLTADQTTIIAAALDATAPAHGEALPLLWHWAYFTPRTPTAAIGPDGHPPTPAQPARPLPPAHVGVGRARRRRPTGRGRARDAALGDRRAQGVGGPVRAPCSSSPSSTATSRAAPTPIVERQTLVYRTPGAPVATPEGDHVPVAEPGEWVEPRCPSPVELFRFSAITFNSHRIHYDAAYARDEEGYPGLVVHGPLTAMTAAASIERTCGRPLATFRFRAVAPLFVGQTSHIVGARDGDDDVAVRVVRNDSATAMEVSGTLATGGAPS